LREAEGREHELLHCEAGDLALEDQRVVARARPLDVAAGAETDVAFALGTPREGALGDCQAGLMRKDPPYDLEYYFATLLLERARGQTVVLNDPRALREANEKLYAMNFPSFIPPTVVTRDAARLRAFQDELGGEMIIKPLDGCGGSGGVFPSGRPPQTPTPPPHTPPSP